MGCDQSSSDTNSNVERDKEFLSMLFKGNYLAVALSDHWSAFMKENQYKQDRNMVEANHLRYSRQSKIVVNSNASQAQFQNLTFDVASRVADCFLGHAMITISNKRWAGSIRHALHGSARRQSSLVITGSVTFNDNFDTKYTVPYNVQYIFYLY